MELLKKILKAAVDGGASDIHIKLNYPIIFRIKTDLVTVEAPKPTTEWMETIIEGIVPEHAKERLQRDREVDFSYYLPGIGRFRTNIFQQRGTFAIAMRYVQTDIPSFEDLGLLPVIKKLAEVPRGIVLVCGITGSGKSTTLAAMLQHINANLRRHIITLEDPIEYVFTDDQSVIEQREIGLDTQSFAFGLKHVLRQDPDVIMVGEMRDDISFKAAIAAAETGHLVLSTMHTTDASQSVSRILDFFQPDERDQMRRQLAGTLHGVICQRMVQTVEGKVTPAFEIMINNGTVKKMILDNKLEKLANAIEAGGDDGMTTFNGSLFKLVKDGIVDQKEALQKATNAQALDMNFKGIFLSEGKIIS